MCNVCVSAMRNTMVIGAPVECQCDYCGSSFIVGKPNQCIECDWFWSEKTDEGYRYWCRNNDADGKEGKCSGFKREGM